MRALVLAAASTAVMALAACDTQTTYIERSLNHMDTLVVEHPPVEANPDGRRNGQAAIAGYCREGGLVRRRDEAGNPVVIRQREACDSVAPRTLNPGEVDPRPTWPANAVSRERVLRSKG
ncbi:hypothetical protein [Methylobacterium sp. E-046]|uniref:hypothetical protein n=1 Tax=Methylobacterium sp. E-046 TaxID=2836576 RepID=UPI001FBBABAF|nr:hypothetical protein [Methylobacterium sp. E-046]MCJ2103750.1 hypothetical protein [Methylobacterium sp. E-046]